MEQTECSETSAYEIQTPGKYPEESIQHHKARCYVVFYILLLPCPSQAQFIT